MSKSNAKKRSRSMRVNKDEPKHTAHHEAGHAVIGRVLGLTCGHATIKLDYEDGSAGHAITYDPWSAIHHWELRGRPDRTRSLFRAGIMTLMAGREAEIACLKNCGDGDGDDQREIALRCASADYDIAENDLPRLRVHILAVCRRHAPVISQVAAELLRYETLEAKQIDEIVRACGVWIPGRIDGEVSVHLQYARSRLWVDGYGRRAFTAQIQNDVVVFESRAAR